MFCSCCQRSFLSLVTSPGADTKYASRYPGKKVVTDDLVFVVTLACLQRKICSIFVITVEGWEESTYFACCKRGGQRWYGFRNSNEGLPLFAIKPFAAPVCGWLFVQNVFEKMFHSPCVLCVFSFFFLLVPTPSIKDVQNHGNYQKMFKADDNRPYVGAIVSPGMH